MITSKDSVEQFKREMKSLNYYKLKIAEAELELESLATIMHGVSSPSFKDVIIENNRNPYHNNFIELMEEEDKLIKEKSMYKRLADIIESKMNKMDKLLLDMCNELYIKRRNHDNVALDHGYNSRQGMYKAINKEIDKIFK